jgi:dTDP-4-amino-4,6-dideoxygalactose transaminase
MTAPIPLVDLGAQHRDVADVVLAGMARVMEATSFIGGTEVTEFEEQFAQFCDAAHCIGVANGTDAIEMMLRAAGIGVGDQVILPANTFIATAGAVRRTGADIVLVDCDDEHLLIDPDGVEAALTDRTRAVIGVDLYGQMAPFDRIDSVIGDRNIELFEDAAQSQGATQWNRPIGQTVRAASTSFYPGKNLGAYGDAGAIVTNDEQLALDVRAIGNHGGIRKYEHRLAGFNSRLDTLQAVVLSAKLAHLADWNARRRMAADRYTEALRGHPGIRLVPVAARNEHVWHLYVIRVAERDRVLAALHEAGIGAGIHYAAPIHLTDAFSDLGFERGRHPHAEASSREMISLPMFPHITEEQQDRVLHTLFAAIEGSATQAAARSEGSCRT